ncbi:MAG: hypothetical protein R3F29_09610 [Planctomycetota bacterium]
MLKNTTLAVLTAAAGLVAQSNTVPGLDGRLTDVNSLTYYGRRGAAHPNGEIGMAMLNTMCNPGSVNIPWYAPMQPDHPKFGFIIARVAGDRIEQINEWSYCKHAFLSVNVNGSCGSCQNPGTGSLMGLNCSDTYGAGNNASRTYLGPPQEIDPWLGTWNPVGSYFDIGDPAQAGYPAAADGTRSLDQSVFSSDAVENRVTVDEIDLTTAGAQYYYGLQLIHQGESIANRGDNNAHRGFNPNWGGSQWSFTNDEPMEYGSILTRWPGAQVEEGHNGNDDGRFYVAVKVTPLGGGVYHYEYAVHNVDNSRAGGSFSVPIDPSATASNFTFGDIDTDGSNDWSGARVGNEVVFTAPANNPLEWNTFYNFGFDATFAPGQGLCQVGEARPGAGAMWVDVPTQVPSGATFASVAAYGSGCGGSQPACQGAVYENPGLGVSNGSSFTLQYSANAYTLVPGAGSWIAPAGATLSLGDDAQSAQTLAHNLPHPGGTATSINVCSNGFLSIGSNGTGYTPSVSTFLGGNPFYAALWHDLNPSGGGSVRFDSDSSRTVVTFDAVKNYSGSLTNTFQVQFWANGDVHFLYQTIGNNGGSYLVGYSLGGGVADPGSISIPGSLNSGLTICGNTSSTPDVSLTASNRPVLGTTVDFVTSDAPAGTLGGISILSTTQLDPGVDLTFLGMPGCQLYVTLDDMVIFPIVGGTGTRSFSFPVNPALSGLQLTMQSATLTPGINAFGFVTSNGLLMVTGVN